MQQLYSTRLNGLDLYFIKMDGVSIETVSTSHNCCIALNSGRERSQVELPSSIMAAVQNAEPLSHHEAKIKPKGEIIKEFICTVFPHQHIGLFSKLLVCPNLARFTEFPHNNLKILCAMATSFALHERK